MSTTAVSLTEYLHTDYSPDVDYIDGELEDRNVGERDHSRLQGLITQYLMNREKEWAIFVYVEQRIQVSPTRFRVPNVAVVAARPVGGVITEPPLLCIEILSPEDRATRLQARINDYLNMGVPCVWLIDPATRRAWIHTLEDAREARDGVLTAGQIRLPLSELGE
jgi:Uma2 family endonuclease